MAEIVGQPDNFQDHVTELTTNDFAEPETWNPIHQQFINNDVDLKAKLETAKLRMYMGV